MIVFLLLAIVGFVASVLVHLASYGHEPLGIEQTWPLHVGIFVVFIPAVVGAQGRRRGGGHDCAGAEYEHAPRWMSRVLAVCGAYALVNFVLFIVIMMGTAWTAGSVRERKGRPVLMKDGEVLREATDEEVRLARARTTRGFSGHWMFFYWASIIGIVDARRRHAIEAARREAAVRSAAAAAAAHAGQPPEQSLGPRPWLGVWGHGVMLIGISILFFFAFPLAEVVLLMSLQAHFGDRLKIFGLIAFILFIPSALAGLYCSQRLLRRIPARCPICEGRAYYVGKTLGSSDQPRPYACADCGDRFDASAD
jgi:hypothetical protein